MPTPIRLLKTVSEETDAMQKQTKKTQLIAHMRIVRLFLTPQRQHRSFYNSGLSLILLSYHS